MLIKSSAFADGGAIPKKYSCDGENISPPLQISGVSEKAKSLVLILHDPDAPHEGGFTHWTMFNLDPVSTALEENSKPLSGIESTNGAGNIGYTGPCPPIGSHHYQFRLYALDATLHLDAKANKADIEKAMGRHIIEQATLVGLYSRSD